MFFIFYISFAFPFWGHGKGAGSEQVPSVSIWGFGPLKVFYPPDQANTNPVLILISLIKKLVDVDKCCSTDRESRDLPL